MKEQLFQSPIRYSGYRINLLPEEQQRATWEARLKDIQPWLPYIQQALAEPFFADDYYLDMPFDELIKQIMTTGELFGCVHNDEVVAFVILRDIRPGRDAWLEGWVAPEFRGKYPCAKQMAQIMDYAFRPWNPELTNSQKMSPKGLGLRKIKASCSNHNRPAALALARLGFMPTGMSLMDGLFKGTLTDILTVEKFNPIYLPKREPQEDVWRQRGRREASAGTTLHTGTGVHSRPAVEDDSRPDQEPTERLYSPGVVGKGYSRRGSRRTRSNPDGLGAVALSETRTDGPREHAEGAEPLHEDSGESRARATGVKPSRKRSGKQ